MLKTLDRTYRGKKVFLTGHTGFKGSWLLRWLHLLGAEVKGYSLPAPASLFLFETIRGGSICSSVMGDVRDQDHLEREIVAYQPDFVFHLAAQALVRPSYESPATTFEINAIGTANVLSALRKLKKPCVVVLITTDKVYENKEWVYPYRETDQLGGRDPYSASKACAEIIISSYVRSFFAPQDFDTHKIAIGIGRAGNVIGGGDRSKDRIIPDIVRSLENHEPVPVRNPSSVRPWQHVLEPLGGYLQLGRCLLENPALSGEAWNFGPLPEDHLTVEDLIKTSIEIWGEGSYQNLSLNGQPHEAGLLKLDISKAMAKLQWKPKLKAIDAIHWTLAWYKNSKDHAEKFTDSQILKYAEL